MPGGFLAFVASPVKGIAEIARRHRDEQGESAQHLHPERNIAPGDSVTHERAEVEQRRAEQQTNGKMSRGLMELDQAPPGRSESFQKRLERRDEQKKHEIGTFGTNCGSGKKT